MTKNALSQSSIQSIERALKILELLQGTDEIGITEIATRLTLPKGTIHGIVKTLEKCGYLEQNQSTRKYRCSSTLMRIGLALLSRSNLHQISQDSVKQLSEKFNQMAYVSVLVRDLCVVIAQHSPNNFFMSLSRIGSSISAYSTAMGKVLLSDFSPEQLDDIFLNASLTKFTRYTITNKDELKKRILEASKKGYDVTHQESMLGLSCVAAPIRDYTGRIIASISITASTDYLSLPEQLSEVVNEVVNAGQNISCKLGYNFKHYQEQHNETVRNVGVVKK